LLTVPPGPRLERANRTGALALIQGCSSFSVCGLFSHLKVWQQFCFFHGGRTPIVDAGSRLGFHPTPLVCVRADFCESFHSLAFSPLSSGAPRGARLFSKVLKHFVSGVTVFTLFLMVWRPVERGGGSTSLPRLFFLGVEFARPSPHHKLLSRQNHMFMTSSEPPPPRKDSSACPHRTNPDLEAKKKIVPLSPSQALPVFFDAPPHVRPQHPTTV